MSNRAFSTAEFARRYAIGHHKALALIEAGEVEAVNVASNPRARPQWRITVEAIEAFERRRASQPKVKPMRRQRTKQSDVIEFF